MSDSSNPIVDQANQIKEMAAALQQFQAALDGLKKLGLINDVMPAPIITVSQASDVDFVARMRAAREAKKAANGGVLPRKIKAKSAPVVPVVKEKAPETVEAFLRWFITTPEHNLDNIKRGQWECVVGGVSSPTVADTVKVAHKLLFHSAVKDGYNSKLVAGNVVCIRPLGSKDVLFNASRLTYGRSWRDQKEPQVIAEAAGAIPVPFEVIKAKGDGGAGLNLDRLELIQRNPTERLLIPPLDGHGYHGAFGTSERHFAGACVIKVENDYFLFDCDREEIKHFGFNPFFTRLPGPAATVEEAYEALKPQGVKDAIRDGKEVIRQGEFFFVPERNDVVEGYILGDKSKQAGYVYQYNQVMRDIVSLGLAQLKDKNETQRYNVQSFIDYTKKNRAGKIWTASGKPTEIDAVTALAAYVQTLTEPLIVRDFMQNNNFQFSRGFNPLRNDIEAADRAPQIENSLGYLLNDGASGNRWTFGQEVGPLSHYNIKIGSALGVVDDKGNSRGRHTVTAMYSRTPTEVYAIGCVSHGGREHRPVMLPGWHRVYSNTATSNWTVSGNVD